MTIALELPDLTSSRDTLVFSPYSFPDDLLSNLTRFTRIPNYETILPFVVAYESIPLWGGNGKSFIKSIPIIFCTGSSGSGKSTLGAILQRLNPPRNCIGDELTIISAGSNYKGWEQSLNDYRLDITDQKKPFPLICIDDLTPDCFTGQVGDLRLGFLKQVVTSSGSFQKGSVDGTPIKTDAYCRLICSSIHDLPTLEGLSELERRILRIQTKKLEDWTDLDHTDLTLSEDMEDHSEYNFGDTYDLARRLWVNENISTFVFNLEQLKFLFKGEMKGFIPRNREVIFSPLIAMTATCFPDNTLIEWLTVFKEEFLEERTAASEGPLTKLLRGFLNSSSNPYRVRMALVSEGYSLDIPYKEIFGFIKVKMMDGEIDRRSCSRDKVIQSMGEIGFIPLLIEAETIFRMEK